MGPSHRWRQLLVDIRGTAAVVRFHYSALDVGLSVIIRALT